MPIHRQKRASLPLLRFLRLPSYERAKSSPLSPVSTESNVPGTIFHASLTHCHSTLRLSAISSQYAGRSRSCIAYLIRYSIESTSPVLFKRFSCKLEVARRYLVLQHRCLTARPAFVVSLILRNRAPPACLARACGRQ